MSGSGAAPPAAKSPPVPAASTEAAVPRWLPHRALPDTTFVSGRGQPHPGAATRSANRAAPHSPPEEAEPLAPLDPADPLACETLLYSLDLFHHGYYWEAHEGLEALWHAAGRQGPVAELFKGLIKLAAAGVKMRQGQPTGVRSHGARAQAHFQSVAEEVGEAFCGFSLSALKASAEAIVVAAEDAERFRAAPGSDDVVRVFDVVLHLAVAPRR